MGVRRGSHPHPGNSTSLPLGGTAERGSDRSRARRPGRTVGRATAGVGVLLGALMLLSGLAGVEVAGDGPYGSTTTTVDQNGAGPSCQLKTKTAPPGGQATVQVRSVPRGAEVEVRFDGRTVAEATATPAGSSPRVNVVIDFVVPASASAGEHFVTAVGAGFSVACQTGDGEELTVAGGEVLSSSVERSGGSEGSLPKTGVYIALLLVIGLVLLFMGRLLQLASRRRVRDVHGGPPPRRPVSSRP